jgi:putative ABC transport system substrate-binding protein
MKKRIRIRSLRSDSGNPKSKIQNLKGVGLVALVVTFALFGAIAHAQQSNKVYRIGFLLTATTDPALPDDVLRALRPLGYAEGQNLQVTKSVKVDELIQLKVDVIVVFGTRSAMDAKKATSTIPIVMTSSANPIESGLIASLARPGGNLTGMTSLSGELGGKRLEVLKEIYPRLSRVIIPAPAQSPTEDAFIKETEPAARVLKLQLIRFQVRGPEDYEKIFTTARKERANGLYNRQAPAITPPAQRKQLVDLVAKHRLPAMYESSVYVDAGGLTSYGTDRAARDRRIAVFIDKIFKGTKPADIPVEQPMHFEFVINLNAAQQIGLTIPPNVLVRAQTVIR